MKRSFRPPAWAWLTTALLLALLLSLGSWQVRRAQAKEVLQASYSAASGAPGIDLVIERKSPAEGRVVAAQAQGRYVADRQLLLDNQSHQGRPGYHVWTPLRLPSDVLIIVSRGWIPLQGAASPPDLTVTEDQRNVRGLWRDLPRPGLRLADAGGVPPKNFPVAVQYPTASTLAATLGEEVAPGVLLLGAAEPDGFVRDWSPAGDFPPSRHYAYAAQWFALAATLLVIFIVMNFKNAPPSP